VDARWRWTSALRENVAPHPGHPHGTREGEYLWGGFSELVMVESGWKQALTDQHAKFCLDGADCYRLRTQTCSLQYWRMISTSQRRGEVCEGPLRYYIHRYHHRMFPGNARRTVAKSRRIGEHSCTQILARDGYKRPGPEDVK
jgi:hypothetical protein